MSMTTFLSFATENDQQPLNTTVGLLDYFIFTQSP